MSYTFRKGYANEITNFECDITTEGELDIAAVVTGSNLYADGTPVRVAWTDSGRSRALYGIYDGSVDKVYYDPKVYTGDTISGGSIFSYEGSDLLEVDVFTLQSEISTAHYSNAHIPYYSNVDYTIKTPRIMGNATDLINLVTYTDVTQPQQNSIVFIDACSNYAYSVRPTVESLDSLNNKYRSSFEFLVAKK